MYNPLKVELKKKVVFIGLTHLALLFYGLYVVIYGIILAEQPFDERQAVTIVMHVLLHLALIILLIVGVLKDIPLCILPWLLAAFPSFILISFYICIYSDIYYFTQLLVNVTVICVLWIMWFTVLKCYLTGSGKGLFTRPMFRSFMNCRRVST